LSEAEKAAVKSFLRSLLAESPFRSRWELARAAEVSEVSLNGWLAPRGGLPDALNLLRLMQAAGAVEERYCTPIPGRRRLGE
jgi:hypothetical protein